MQEPKKYDLYLSRYFKIMVFGMLALFTGIGVLLVSGVFIGDEGNGPPWFFGILWLGMVGWNWYWVLSFPHRIIVSETGEIIFISLLRKKRVSELEIESIKPQNGQFGFLVVKTANGKIRLLNQFDGFHDFIFNLKSKRPTIEIRGC